jgi:hypothetical protein
MNTAHLMVIDRLVDAMILRMWIGHYDLSVEDQKEKDSADKKNKATISQVKREIPTLFQEIFKETKNNGWKIAHNYNPLTQHSFIITNQSSNATNVSIYISQAGVPVILFSGPLIKGYNAGVNTKFTLYGDAYNNCIGDNEKKTYLSTALNLPA